MFVTVFFATSILLGVHAAIIPHHYDISHPYSHSHGHATSYQSVKISSYHPVPVYLKKEHQQYLAHPVEAGHTSTQVQVQHGGEHDNGYAVVGGRHQQEGYEQQDLGGYQHEQQELSQYESGDLQDHQGHGLQAYATQEATSYEHGAQEAPGGYEQGAAEYEQNVEDDTQHHYQ